MAKIFANIFREQRLSDASNTMHMLGNMRSGMDINLWPSHHGGCCCLGAYWVPEYLKTPHCRLVLVDIRSIFWRNRHLAVFSRKWYMHRIENSKILHHTLTNTLLMYTVQYHGGYGWTETSSLGMAKRLTIYSFFGKAYTISAVLFVGQCVLGCHHMTIRL